MTKLLLVFRFSNSEEEVSGISALPVLLMTSLLFMLLCASLTLNRRL